MKRFPERTADAGIDPTKGGWQRRLIGDPH